MKQAKKLIMIFLVINLMALYAFAGDLEPPAGDPAPSMHTLEDIYNKIDSIANPDKSFPTATGQTLCYDSNGTVIPCAGTGQDGEYQKGVPRPTPRFTDNGDGTVTDNLTNLIWLKNANPCGSVSWADALTYCNELAEDTAGLTDGSTAGDWRMPNISELASLVSPGQNNPWGLPPGHPFTNVIASWSSTTDPENPEGAFNMNFTTGGNVEESGKPLSAMPVWPVRDDLD